LKRSSFSSSRPERATLTQQLAQLHAQRHAKQHAQQRETEPLASLSSSVWQ
jgi:hypothetical protein